MKKIDLERLAEDQIVAESIILQPVGELDEAGKRWPTSDQDVAFGPGDTVVIFGENQSETVAYKNYGKPPTSGLPPYLFRTEDIRRIMVEGSHS